MYKNLQLHYYIIIINIIYIILHVHNSTSVITKKRSGPETKGKEREGTNFNFAGHRHLRLEYNIFKSSRKRGVQQFRKIKITAIFKQYDEQLI